MPVAQGGPCVISVAWCKHFVPVVKSNVDAASDSSAEKLDLDESTDLLSSEELSISKPSTSVTVAQTLSGLGFHQIR